MPFSRARKSAPKPLGPKYVPNPVTLGDKLRNRRLELGLLQKDVARLLRVSEDTVTYWENNRYEPSAKYYTRIHLFLTTKPQQL